MKKSTGLLCALIAGASTTGAVGQIQVTGGQTSVLLNLDALEAAAGLALTGASEDVIFPGNLGMGSVAFPINARDAGSLPTTFEYAPGLASFSGTIEHTGTIEFNQPMGDTDPSDDVTVGNFRIGFDAGRATDGRSGFFVQDTFSLGAILFDVAAPSEVVAEPGDLTIRADLLVSPEFGAALVQLGFAESDLTGVAVGEALVQAVPAPGSAAVLAAAGLLASRRRR